MTTRNLKTLSILCVVGLVLLSHTSPAWGFAYWSQETDPTGYTHILNNPNDYPSWDLTTITYKFDSSFTTDNRIRDQVRLAFAQWDNADATALGTQYSYNRANGVQPFVDLRSVAVHEIGHTLGIRHPNQAAGVSRNWRPSGATYVQQADNGNEVMRSWINEGDYNQILSHDELDAFDYSYGNDLNFTEVTGSANIVIGTYTAGSNIWAVGGWSGSWRNGADHSQGIRITSGSIDFNTTTIQPLGYQTLGINWDYQNPSAKATRRFEIRTRGTTNPDPVSHYDGNATRRFDTYATSPIGAPNQKNDVLHTWSSPRIGGVPADFAPSDIIHVGVEQDVWDWTIVSAQVVHPDGTKSNAPVIWSHQWDQTITGVDGASASGSNPGEDGITAGPRLQILAQGIQIGATEVMPVELRTIGLAIVDDMGLGLADLNRETLNRLMKGQQFEMLDIQPMTLDNNGVLTLVLDGTPFEPPNPVFIPGGEKWLGHTLFLYAETTDLLGEATIGNYALLGSPPIVGVPEPSTLVLLIAGVGILLGCAWRRQRRT